MTLAAFTPSAPLTLGVELELQIIARNTRDLSPRATQLLDLLAEQPFPGDAKPEMTQSMIEVSTDIHHSVASLHAQLCEIRDTLASAASTLGVRLAGGGTHPFQLWQERRIYPGARYEALANRYGYLARQFTVFGQHIHVGVESGDDAMYLTHALARYVPHFIALAASSPYCQGADTGFSSSRLNSVFAFPLSGHAPPILEWARFEHEFYEPMRAAGIVASMKDFYWDIRPKPEYGTVELRVCDTPLDVDHAAALAAYLQVLALRLLADRSDPPQERDYLCYTFNRFEACRFGFDGQYVDPRTLERRNLREDILDTLDRIADDARALDCSDALAGLARFAQGETLADWLRAQMHAPLPSHTLVDAATARFLT